VGVQVSGGTSSGKLRRSGHLIEREPPSPQERQERRVKRGINKLVRDRPYCGQVDVFLALYQHLSQVVGVFMGESNSIAAEGV